LINDQRAARHLPTLRHNRRLDRASQRWTDRMVATSTFTHVSGGIDPGVRMEAAGYDWSAYGENIATGFATPRDVVHAWMASTDHCRNILDPQYVDVGTGVNNNPVIGFASGPASWTQDFGLPAYISPPSDNFTPANGCPYSTPVTPSTANAKPPIPQQSVSQPTPIDDILALLLVRKRPSPTAQGPHPPTGQMLRRFRT
jgi:hypothetical protein